MPTEIERNFRLPDGRWRLETRDATTIRQGFLVTQPERTVRVRVTDMVAPPTIKGRSEGARRAEHEYSLSWDEAEEMLTPSACFR